jgi:DNA-directed RNA polymerase specialized sigma24 family protein
MGHILCQRIVAVCRASYPYQVAYRLAAEARTRIARRDVFEKQAAQRLEPAAAKPEGLREVCAVLDEALHGLPDRYQQPLVLCYLEGLTRDQAAGQLGWSLRTLERRLVLLFGLCSTGWRMRCSSRITFQALVHDLPGRHPAA